MSNSLDGQVVLVIGRGSGIARAVTELAVAEGARVIVAGRAQAALAAAYAATAVQTETVDVTDDESIQQLVARVGRINHLVSTVSAPAAGPPRWHWNSARSGSTRSRPA